MPYTLFIAKRYLSPKRETGFISFITLISIAGIAIGVAALIIAVSVLNGFEKEITGRAISLSSHIQVLSFKQEGIKDFQSLINTLKDPSQNFGIKSAGPYVLREAVIKFKDRTEGVMIKGVRNEDSIFSSQRKIISGSPVMLQADSLTSSMIIGNKLAGKLGITTGSKVFIIATRGIPSPSNPPSIKAFIVTGIYESGLREYDDVLVYTELKDARQLFSMGENITGIELTLENVDKIKSTSESIKRNLGYPYTARTVFQNFKGLFTWIELQKEPIPIVLGLIIIVAAINIIGFLLMIVLEKTESIGVLKSMGATNRDIVIIFFVQGMLISAAGIIAGNLIGYGLCFLQLKYDLLKIPEIYYMTRVPLQFDWSTGIIITAIAFLLSILVTVIPSYLASRLNPVTSLRFK